MTALEQLRAWYKDPHKTGIFPIIEEFEREQLAHEQTAAAIRRCEEQMQACEEMARMGGGDVSIETVARWFRAALAPATGAVNGEPDAGR